MARSSGTVLVKDIRPGSASSNPHSLTNVNGTLFFVANNGTHGHELWKSDGTFHRHRAGQGHPAGLGWLLSRASHQRQRHAVFPGQRWHQRLRTLEEQWHFRWHRAGQGHPAGLGWLHPHHLTNVNGTLFFRANDGTKGRELWKSNGTSTGTVLVRDIRPGAASSYPRELTNVNGTLFFEANDGTSGYELWKSDGTSTGTVLVKDIQTGAASSGPSGLTNVNGTLFFAADDGTHGVELWKSNGTSSGTVLVKNIGTLVGFGSYPSWFTNVNGTLFFSADEGTSFGSPGRELWKSDGTSAGTVRVLDINSSGNSNPSWLTNVNGTLFFVANNGTNGSNSGRAMARPPAPCWSRTS
jgi:ELWxxDGT repeat protein